MSKPIYDTIIVGGAAAGLTAAMYASRRAMKTLLITKNIGGQAAITKKVENYPGFLNIEGIRLMQKILEQATKAGAEVLTNLEVKEIVEKKGSDNTLEFTVKTGLNKYKAKSVILAFGKTPRNLCVPGESKFLMKGVSYCAICDLPLFVNKTIAIVGGGNSALDAAIYAAKVCKRVYLIHRRDEFRGFEYLAEKVKHLPKVEILYSHVVTEIKGDKKVNSIIVQDLRTNKKEKYFTDGVFVEIGSEVKTDLIKNSVKLDKNNQVIVNQNCETFYPNSDKIHPGIFSAGDVTNTPFKQIVIAAGDGAKAALQAWNYLHEMKTTFIADWGKKTK